VGGSVWRWIGSLGPLGKPSMLKAAKGDWIPIALADVSIRDFFMESSLGWGGFAIN
jgi:hypothetical protein